MIRKFVIPVLSSLLLCASSSWALDLVPFQVRNLSPTTLVYNLAIAEPARQPAAGHASIRLGFDLANLSSLNDSGGESILLDGQTSVTTLGLRYALSDQLQFGVDVRWVQHKEGFLDNFVADWHSFFGLPNGDRDNLPEDQLAYHYQLDGLDRVSLLDETSGIGDLRLLLAWQFKKTDQGAYALQAWVKAPTGDADKLTGSGAWDFSLALSAQRDFPLGDGRGAYWGGVGINRLGTGDGLAGDVEDWAGNGWLGAGWSPLDWLALKLQLDVHTALYDSRLAELGDSAVILTLGGTLGFSERTFLDIGVGEDLAVNASPDVSFHFSLGHRF